MNVIKINKKRMIIFLIITVFAIIGYALIVGNAKISFKPFTFSFERPYNLLGWITLIMTSVFWQIDSCKVRDKEIRKETEEIEKYYNNEFSRSLQDLKDKISKSNVDTTDVQLNNKNKTLDNGN